MSNGNMSAHIEMGFSVHATLSARQQRTGRYITADAEHARFQAWSESKNPDGGEAQLRFVESLSSARQFDSRELIGYRGRRFSIGKEPQPTDMGPPPKGASDGRYNKSGQFVLYLCTSEEGVTREPIEGEDPLWIQKFRLPTDSLKIADLRPDYADEYANQVFWFTESAERGNKCGFGFSQHIAALVANKFDGMIIPGVRGDKSHLYSNVVVLKRMSEWPSWLYPASRPDPAANAVDDM